MGGGLAGGLAGGLVRSDGRRGGCFRGELLSFSARALLLNARLEGVLWIPAGEVLTEAGSDIPFSVGVGGSSSSSTGTLGTVGRTPVGGERCRTRPRKGSMKGSSSSVSVGGGGKGLGEGLWAILRVREGKVPAPCCVPCRVGVVDPAAEPGMGTALVGDVFRRFGAESSMIYLYI